MRTEDGRLTELAYDAGRQLASIMVPGLGGDAGVTTSFGYDVRGNRVTATADAGPAAGTVTHTFDLADRLTSVMGVDGTATTYAYDGAGLRASATTGGVTQSFVWDVTAAYPLLLTDAEHAYVYGVAGVPLAQVGLDDGAVDYLHVDALGSVVATTDAAGTVTAEGDYDLYGVPLSDVGADPVGAVTRFGYAGEYTDPTGYIYLRARYYDPATAQFLTVDPLVDTTGNPYGYTGGNPLQYVDPLGLDALQDFGDWVAGFGDTLTFGGTREIRRLINYLAWGETDDMVDNCSVFYEWGGYAGNIASLVPLTGGLAWATRGLSALAPRATAAVSNAVARTTAAVSNAVARATAAVSRGMARVSDNIAVAMARGADAGSVSLPGRGAANTARTSGELRPVGAVLESIDDVYANPQLLSGQHPVMVESMLRGTPGWRIETLGRGSHAGQGWVFRQYTGAGNPTGLQLRWHPGGGHHGPAPYWRVVGPNGDLGGIIR